MRTFAESGIEDAVKLHVVATLPLSVRRRTAKDVEHRVKTIARRPDASGNELR
eukprot:CAMPEP_0181494898 /NCGR_PEP_ID=MMETSP1110-20121109/52071_1 /TAXON_ID=174948 /ORGANISM="Symbiodinium sp., Strain CCMP421" /LENGTH=52 /DNA_ID=CAMNT_0023622449 /DNA_START=83 /DNA_END=238 /DNA_ORIENTATION=+